jgi:hypothetical protein
MDCSAMVFVNEFSFFFLIFSVVLLVLGCPEHSSSTDTQPALKQELHSKIDVQIKECSPKASQSISRALVGDLLSFTQNLMQTRCSILSSITDKMKHKVKKAKV